MSALVSRQQMWKACWIVASWTSLSMPSCGAGSRRRSNREAAARRPERPFLSAQAKGLGHDERPTIGPERAIHLQPTQRNERPFQGRHDVYIVTQAFGLG